MDTWNNVLEMKLIENWLNKELAAFKPITLRLRREFI